jgi:energy-coupling factor transporter ATP-binding protein EcfA2
VKPDFSRETRRVLVAGPSGSGKSTWALAMLGAWRGRLLAFDHKGEVAKLLGVRPVADKESMGAEIWKRRGRVCFQPHGYFGEDLQPGFEWFCAVAKQVAKSCEGETLLFVDELQDWLDPRRDLPRAFRWCLESGRVHGLHFCGIVQGANLSHNRLRQQMTEVVAFAQSEPRALEFLNACGLDGRRVATLPKLSFLHRSRVTGQEQEGRILWPGPRILVSPQRQLL